MLSDSLSDLWVLSECLLTAYRLLTYSWLIAWRFEPVLWILTALDKFETDERTNGRRASWAPIGAKKCQNVPVRDKSECVHAKMLYSLLVFNGQGSTDVLVENVEYLVLFNVRRKQASVSSMNPVTSLFTSVLIIIPGRQVGFVVIFHNRSKIKNTFLSCVDLKLFFFSIILSWKHFLMKPTNWYFRDPTTKYFLCNIYRKSSQKARVVFDPPEGSGLPWWQGNARNPRSPLQSDEWYLMLRQS